MVARHRHCTDTLIRALASLLVDAARPLEFVQLDRLDDKCCESLSERIFWRWRRITGTQSSHLRRETVFRPTVLLASARLRTLILLLLLSHSLAAERDVTFVRHRRRTPAKAHCEQHTDVRRMGVRGLGHGSLVACHRERPRAPSRLGYGCLGSLAILLQLRIAHADAGRELSSSDGAFILTLGPFPTDPLSGWYRCVMDKAGLDGAIRFDVKTGPSTRVRYDTVFIVVWPQDLQHIHIVPGPLWFEATTKLRGESRDWRWIFHQCAVKLEDVPEALGSLAAAAESTRDRLAQPSAGIATPRKWYRNPSNGLEFDGWNVPPPVDVAAFTHMLNTAPKVQMSEQAIQRMWQHLKLHPNLQLFDNPVKPLISDLVLTHRDSQTGAQHQYFIEHKASDRGGQSLKSYLDPKYHWHVLISQSNLDGGGDEYKVAFAGEWIPTRLAKGSLGEVLSEKLQESGHEIRAAKLDRWGSDRPEETGMGVAEEDLADYELDEPVPGPFDDLQGAKEKAPADDEIENENEDAKADDDDGQQKLHTRNWRVSNDETEAYVRDMLNDQSWHLGQHVFLVGSNANSHGTSFLVEHKWTEEEKLAYKTSRTLPGPDLDGRAIPIAFGRRLYEYRSGERQYLKSSTLKYHCSKIRTVYIFTASIKDVKELKEVTLHCSKASSGNCTQCDEEHQYIKRKQGETVHHTFDAGAETHPKVVEGIGECLGLFELENGRLWQRCVDLFDEDATYSPYALRELLRSTWKHGSQRPRAPSQVNTRWVPCNTCWAAKRLCDDRPTGRCRECKRRGESCVRKRCCFYDDPEACEDPECSEAHNTDSYNLLTDSPRVIGGSDRRRDDAREDALQRRIPACDHCWSNGWYLLCSTAEVCFMCSKYNKQRPCIRTRCQFPDNCNNMRCYYAHGNFTGACSDYEPRTVVKSIVPRDLRNAEKQQIADERKGTLRGVNAKVNPHHYTNKLAKK